MPKEPSSFVEKVTRRRLLGFFSKLNSCLVGIEACGTAHYWARELIGLGHEVRLMPPSYVKPYVKRQKNDMADAEAICEAVTRPTMRFVPVKSPEQQSVDGAAPADPDTPAHPAVERDPRSYGEFSLAPASVAMAFRR